MFRFLIAASCGGLVAMIGYALGALFTDDVFWALVFAAVAFAVGFAVAAAAAGQAARDEHSTSTHVID